MKVLFVDDQHESLKNICFVLDEFYGMGNVTKVKDARSALELLQQTPFLIDIAIIDQNLNNEESGVQLAKNISTLYRYIPMIMLSGRLDLSLSKEAMRAGFSDVLDKSSDISTAKRFREHLERINQMEVVQSKWKLKKETQDIEFKIYSLKHELNKAKLSLPFKLKRVNKNRKPTEPMMEYHQKALEQCAATNTDLDSQNLGMAMMIQETRGVAGQVDVTKVLAEAKSVGLNTGTDFTALVQGRLQLFSDDVITERGHEVHWKLRTEPEKWESTIRFGRGEEGKPKMLTFFDRLINEYL
ncbi:MAG: response regulator [Bacteroidetes bacterium]|nr:response regulator [Bacteroidota bacterium]